MSTAAIDMADPAQEAMQEAVQEMADILRDLIGLDARIARAFGEKTLRQIAETGPVPAQPAPTASRTPDPAVLFMRMYTNIRQAVTLHIRLTKGRKTNTAGQHAASKPHTAEADELKSKSEQLAKLGREIAKNAKLAA
jgi:hypothetical protein